MIDELLEILEKYDYPVYRQGSMSEDEVYPETMITFWNVDSPDHAFYDNTDYGTDYEYTVNVYSSDPEVPYSVLDSIIADLKEANWIVNGKGYDVASDVDTHTGRGIEIYYSKY